MFDTNGILHQAIMAHRKPERACSDSVDVAAIHGMDTRRSCPICAGNAATVLHRQRFVLGSESPLPAEYSIVSCTRCAFVYADTDAGQAAYDRYYEENSRYEDVSVSTGSGVDALDSIRLENTATIILELARSLRIKGKIVDVGCAGGGLLRILRARGLSQLSGIDASQRCVDRVIEAGLAATKATLAEVQQLSGTERGAIVILSHVLEHVWDVRNSVIQLLSLMQPGGIVYLEVPDASRYHRIGFPPFYFFDSEHINHFDLESLRNLASETGLKVITYGEHDIVVGNGKEYPVVWVALSNNAPATVSPRLVPANGLRDSVVRYIAESSTNFQFDRMEDLAASGCAVVLWGAGSHAQRLLSQSPLARCNIVAIVDRNVNKQGREFFGQRISEPEAILSSLDRNTVVVIASVLHAEQIRSEIRARGIVNEIVVEG